MSDWTIYYYQRCGSCRKALEALHDKNIQPKIVEYMKHPLSPAELDDILKKLGISPEFLVRTNEDKYEEMGLEGKKLSRAEWIKILAENPELMRRPIVTRGNRGVIARHSVKVNWLVDLM